MSPEEIAEIQARCDRASPGPWRSMIEGRDHESGSDFIMVGPPDARGDDIELSGATHDDQDFIAHARQDVPRLLDEVRRLRALLGEPDLFIAGHYPKSECSMSEDRMSPEEIAEIQARCDRASLSPWKSWIEGRDYMGGSDFIMVGPPKAATDDIELWGATKDDQDFIADARQDVPRLLEEARRLRALLGEK